MVWQTVAHAAFKQNLQHGFHREASGCLRSDIYRHCAMERLQPKPLQMRMEDSRVAVSAEPFRVPEQRTEINTVDNAHSAVTAANAPDGLHLRIANRPLETGSPLRISAGKLAATAEQMRRHPDAQAIAFQHSNRTGKLAFRDFPCRCHQSHRIARVQYRITHTPHINGNIGILFLLFFIKSIFVFQKILFLHFVFGRKTETHII